MFKPPPANDKEWHEHRPKTLSQRINDPLGPDGREKVGSASADGKDSWLNQDTAEEDAEVAASSQITAAPIG